MGFMSKCLGIDTVEKTSGLPLMIYWTTEFELGREQPHAPFVNHSLGWDTME